MPDQIPDVSLPQDPGTPASVGAAKNKTMLLLVGFGALAIIAAVIVALVVFVPMSSTTTTAPSSPATSTGGSSQSATDTAAEVKEPASAVVNSEVFTFRDIFLPLLSKDTSPTTSATTVADSSTTTTVAATSSSTSTAGTLYLTDVSSENGTYTGTFVLDGKTYTLGDGDQVGTSPWQVVTVNSSSAVMLYGDTRVTLTVGQGISK